MHTNEGNSVVNKVIVLEWVVSSETEKVMGCTLLIVKCCAKTEPCNFELAHLNKEHFGNFLV